MSEVPDYDEAMQNPEVRSLIEAIERAIQRETGGGVRDLRVEVTSSGVVLTGRCDSYYTKQRAQQGAFCVSGVDPGRLMNKIEVV